MVKFCRWLGEFNFKIVKILLISSSSFRKFKSYSFHQGLSDSLLKEKIIYQGIQGLKTTARVCFVFSAINYQATFSSLILYCTVYSKVNSHVFLLYLGSLDLVFLQMYHTQWRISFYFTNLYTWLNMNYRSEPQKEKSPPGRSTIVPNALNWRV